MARLLSMLALERRAAVLADKPARARALQLLAPTLRDDRPLEAVVALLTVADVFPKSRAHRVRLGRAVLGNGQTVDDLATALAFWLEHGRSGPWIAATLHDPTAPARHAARRAFRVLVGQLDELVLDRIRPVFARIAAALWHVEQVDPPPDLELSDRARRYRQQLLRLRS